LFPSGALGWTPFPCISFRNAWSWDTKKQTNCLVSNYSKTYSTGTYSQN